MQGAVDQVSSFKQFPAAETRGSVPTSTPSHIPLPPPSYPWPFLPWPLFLVEMRRLGRCFMGNAFVGTWPKGKDIECVADISLSRLLAVSRTSQPQEQDCELDSSVCPDGED